MISSKSAKVWARIDSIASATNAAPSRTGSPMLTVGVSSIRRPKMTPPQPLARRSMRAVPERRFPARCRLRPEMPSIERAGQQVPDARDKPEHDGSESQPPESGQPLIYTLDEL